MNDSFVRTVLRSQRGPAPFVSGVSHSNFVAFNSSSQLSPRKTKAAPILLTLVLQSMRFTEWPKSARDSFVKTRPRFLAYRFHRAHATEMWAPRSEKRGNAGDGGGKHGRKAAAPASRSECGGVRVCCAWTSNCLNDAVCALLWSEWPINRAISASASFVRQRRTQAFVRRGVQSLTARSAPKTCTLIDREKCV